MITRSLPTLPPGTKRGVARRSSPAKRRRMSMGTPPQHHETLAHIITVATTNTPHGMTEPSAIHMGMGTEGDARERALKRKRND